MGWWKDLIAPTIAGVIVSGVTILITCWFERKRDKICLSRDLQKLRFDLKALIVELKENSVGRGFINKPFQFFLVAQSFWQSTF